MDCTQSKGTGITKLHNGENAMKGKYVTKKEFTKYKNKDKEEDLEMIKEELRKKKMNKPKRGKRQ